MSTAGNEIVAQSGWDPAELERPSRCLSCGESSLENRYLGLNDLLGHLPGEWGFAACRNCDALHLDPRPTVDSVGKAYPDAYVTHDDSKAAHSRDNGSSWFWRLANGYLNRRFGSQRAPSHKLGPLLIPLFWPLRQQLDYFLRQLPRTPGRLLDVGCGNGAFMLRARESGWDVEGIEPDPRAAAAASAAGLLVHSNTIGSYRPSAQFDRITLSHVFEHVHEPAVTLATCFSWLRPNGELWMSLPNPHGIGSRIFGRSWFALDPPRHLFLPPPAAVVRMMREAGFVDVKLLRRGRGSRSSIVPSVEYASIRGEPTRHWNGRQLAFLIDIVASVFPTAAEETVVLGRRPEV